MTRRALTATILMGVLVFATTGSAAAPAKPAKVATTVEVESLFAAGPYAVVGGSIASDDPRCLGNRQVAITVIDKDGEPIAFDVARTGADGGWAGVHELTSIQDRAPLQAIKAEVRKRKIAISKHKTLVCQARRTSISLP